MRNDDNTNNTNIQKCEECNILPTKHKCIICRSVWLCPECCDKRGLTDLNDIRCRKCQNGDTDDRELMPPPPPAKKRPTEVIEVNAHPNDDETTVTQVDGTPCTPAASVITMPPKSKIVATEGNCRLLQNIPNRMHRKMGMNAEIVVSYKNIIPFLPVKEKHPNTYKLGKCKCIVRGICEYKEERKQRKKKEVSWVPYLLIRFGDVLDDPGGDNEWRVNLRNCKLIRPGPPNQYFNLQIGKATVPEPDADVAVVVDRESDVEEEDDEITTTAGGIYDVHWEKTFVDGINLDNRGMLSKEKARLVNYREVDFLTKLALFKIFSPTKFITETLIPATNEELKVQLLEEMKEGEFYGWLGLWFIIQLNPGYSTKDFFSLKNRTVFWNPPYLGGYMSGKRFLKITECIRFQKREESPRYRDKFFYVREMINSFNDNMTFAFSASWLVCVDESMVVFYNKYAPGWIAVKRKPHPLGNEYHTVACCESKIIFFMELVEGKDKPKEGAHSEAQFEKDFGSKIAALVVRMTTPIWGSGRAVLLDSGFGYIPSVVQLKNKGLYATAVIKKKRAWPKHTQAEDAIQEMVGKDVGTIRVRRGRYKTSFGEEQIYLVALADSLHTSLMLSNWATTRRTGDDKYRRVGNNVVTFQYGEVQTHYYFGRHAVDDNNNNRQGCLSFEDVFVPKDWNKRQFGFIISVSQVNAFLAYNYFIAKEKEKEITKAEFVRDLAKELVTNEVWIKEKGVEEEKIKKEDRKRKRRAEKHELRKLPTNRGKWNGRCFRKVKQAYQKYKCSYGCGTMTREYCLCDKNLMLCRECYALHKTEEI